MYPFQSLYNQEEHPHYPEKNTMPSATVPDMALSVKDLLKRYNAGQPLGGRHGEYDEEDPDDSFYVIPGFDQMDLAEKEELAIAAKAEVDRLRAILNDKALREREEKDKASLAEQRKLWEESLEKPGKRAKKASGEDPDASTNIS